MPWMRCRRCYETLTSNLVFIECPAEVGQDHPSSVPAGSYTYRQRVGDRPVPWVTIETCPTEVTGARYVRSFRRRVERAEFGPNVVCRYCCLPLGWIWEELRQPSDWREGPELFLDPERVELTGPQPPVDHRVRQIADQVIPLFEKLLIDELLPDQPWRPALKLAGGLHCGAHGIDRCAKCHQNRSRRSRKPRPALQDQYLGPTYQSVLVIGTTAEVSARLRDLPPPSAIISVHDQRDAFLTASHRNVLRLTLDASRVRHSTSGSSRPLCLPDVERVVSLAPYLGAVRRQILVFHSQRHLPAIEALALGLLCAMHKSPTLALEELLAARPQAQPSPHVVHHLDHSLSRDDLWATFELWGRAQIWWPYDLASAPMLSDLDPAARTRRLGCP